MCNQTEMYREIADYDRRAAGGEACERGRSHDPGTCPVCLKGKKKKSGKGKRVCLKGKKKKSGKGKRVCLKGKKKAGKGSGPRCPTR